MNLADILNVCRTGSGVYLPCSVSTADNSLSYRNPRIVVAEDAGVLLVSRWIRRDFTKLHMISVVRRLQEHDAIFSIKIFLNRLHCLKAEPFILSDFSDNTKALWFNKDFSILTFLGTNLVLVVVVCTKIPLAIPAGIHDGLFHLFNSLLGCISLVAKSLVSADFYIVFSVFYKHACDKNRFGIRSFRWSKGLEGLARLLGEAV